jgi:hypothetical protein
MPLACLLVVDLSETPGRVIVLGTLTWLDATSYEPLAEWLCVDVQH